MNRDSYLTLLLAVCCIGAAGVSATTLSSTLEQEPDDVVDIDFSKLPIGEEGGKAAEGALNGEGKEKAKIAKEGSKDNSDLRTRGSSNQDGENAPSSESDDEGKEGPAKSSEREAESQAAQSEDSGRQFGAGGGKGMGTGGKPSLLQRLLNLLMDLLPLLLLVLALALAYRYRYHLLALALAIKGVLLGDEVTSSSSATAWPDQVPSNEVHRAWLSMVSETGIDDPQRRTPSECATAAIEEGHDPGAVQTLTETFEEVRYGGKPVTDERRERARKGLDRIGGGGTV
jgi:preprotein translocase subunit SecG